MRAKRTSRGHRYNRSNRPQSNSARSHSMSKLDKTTSHSTLLGISATNAAFGTCVVGVLMCVLDLVLRLPFTHILMVTLIASVTMDARNNIIFTGLEFIVFAGVASSTFFAIYKFLPATLLVFAADAALIGHAALQIFVDENTYESSSSNVSATKNSYEQSSQNTANKLSSSKINSFRFCHTNAGKLRAWIMLSLWLLFDLLLACTMRSFINFYYSRLIISISASLDCTFLAYLMLGHFASYLTRNNIISSDWVQVDPYDSIDAIVKKLNGPEPPNAEPPVKHKVKSSLVAAVETIPQSDVLPKDNENTPLLEQTNIADKGFLDRFVAHKKHINALEAKRRLLAGALLQKYSGKTQAATSIRQRYLRLNLCTAMIEWWKPDRSRLVGQSRVEDLLHVIDGHTNTSNILHNNQNTSTKFTLKFTSRSIELEAETVEQAKQWRSDIQLLIDNKDSMLTPDTYTNNI